MNAENDVPVAITNGLIPSQAVKSKSQRHKNRRRRKPKSKTQKIQADDGKTNSEENAKVKSTSEDAKEPNTEQKSSSSTGTGKQKPKRKPKPKKKKKKFPWRKEVPSNTVDPISLEPLVSMAYPPFALNISPPYDIVPEWPIPKKDEKEAVTGTSATKKKENTILKVDDSQEPDTKRQDDLLQEQWGDLLPDAKIKSKDDKVSDEDKGEGKGNGPEEDDADAKQHQDSNTSTQHFHLFDGRVLAVYLVSTLQFIDPLNRRDLTREEIKNLDSYLARHRLKKMRVLEAYDDKGISMSTAGAGAQTQSGRLQMRQEQARNLLNSLFQDDVGIQQGDQQGQGGQRERSGRNGGRNANNSNGNRRNGRNAEDSNSSNSNAMMNQYAAYESNQQARQSSAGALDHSQNNYGYDQWSDAYGTNGHDAGMIIIDDNVNPGLRGGLSNASHSASLSAHAPSWHGHRAASSADNFPSLPSAAATNQNHDKETHEKERENKKTNKARVVSKSLSKIGKFGEKSDPKQLEKQRKAREMALRKAEIANMPYEEAIKRAAEDNFATSGDSSMVNEQAQTRIAPTLPPSESQLERNRKLADALDVKPSTVRSHINSGWSRPTRIPIKLDEFGNELNLTQYSDDLIIEARERMTELLRLENKWLSFLKDDKAASCPLKPMDRPLRKFFHAYSDFWNLHTQSFDPQPKRYIHCVKLLETRAPRPLLSAAVRTWRGPAPPPLPIPPERTPTTVTEQAAGEDTLSSREFLQTEERTPLKLEPRSAMDRFEPPPGAMFDLVEEDATMIANKGDAAAPFASHQPAPRFAPVLEERERPTLQLEKRTKPLELPKYQQPATVNTSEMEMNYQSRMNASQDRSRMEEERKKKIIAAAFESDDEEESDDDSDWEVQEAVVQSSDDDEW